MGDDPPPHFPVLVMQRGPEPPCSRAPPRQPPGPGWEDFPCESGGAPGGAPVGGTGEAEEVGGESGAGGGSFSSLPPSLTRVKVLPRIRYKNTQREGWQTRVFRERGIDSSVSVKGGHFDARREGEEGMLPSLRSRKACGALGDLGALGAGGNAATTGRAGGALGARWASRSARDRRRGARRGSVLAAAVLLLLAFTGSGSVGAVATRHRHRLRLRHRASTAEDPGAAIAATIAKLKSTEAKLRDTQSSMQLAVDKMKKKRSFGIDKHIAHTTEMVMTAFHKKEMENLARAADSRLHYHFNGSKEVSDNLEDVNTGEVMEDVMSDGSGSEIDNLDAPKRNSDVYQAELDKIPKNDPDSKRRAIEHLKAEEDLRSSKAEEEESKEQMKAAQWKLAADAQNAALAAQYAEWQRKAEEDSKLVQAREQAEAAAALAEEAEKAGASKAAQEKLDRERDAQANAAADAQAKLLSDS